MSGRTGAAVKSFFLIVLGVFIFQALFANASGAAEDQLLKIRVGYSTHERSGQTSSGNNGYGYSYDFLQEIAQYHNWELEFIPGTESESVKRLLVS